MGSDLQKCQILVDTGSSVNVMPISKAKKMGCVVETGVPEALKVLRGFNGSHSTVIGTTKQLVRIGNWESELIFVVVTGDTKLILGMSELTELDLSVDPARQCLKDSQSRSLLCHPSQEGPPCYCLVEKGIEKTEFRDHTSETYSWFSPKVY